MLKLAYKLRPYILHIILTIAMVFVQVMTDLELPDYMSDIINNGIFKGDNGYILITGLKMLGVACIGMAATILAGYLAARVAAGATRSLRNEVFEKVEHFSLNEFDKFSTASLITRSTNDIQQMQMVIIVLLRMVVSAPITAVGGIMKAVQTSPEMSWILAISIPLTLATVFSIMAMSIPKFKRVQLILDKLNLVCRENLTGIRISRAFRTEKYEEEKFAEVNGEYMRINVFLQRLMGAINPGTILILNITQCAIIWFGAKAVGAGTVNVGDVMAFIQYAIQVMFSFMMLSMVSIMLPRASASAVRIREILDTKTSIPEPEKPESVPSEGKNTVEFRGVSFSYPGASEPVLKDISFKAKDGETVAVIGSTGCGKTTLVNLIPRFYDVTEGEVLINGIDVRRFSQHDLHDMIGYVPQKGMLFSGTVSENLRFGKEEATDEEVKKAAEIAQAADFISQKEEGYGFEIAQGGTNVSGGQKQRLSIARAIIKSPKIYIFDDSFSALDYKTDVALRSALNPYTKNAITIIVAQRISTILHADRIIVLEDGVVAGMGRHAELMKSCQVYSEIASSQLSKEELA